MKDKMLKKYLVRKARAEDIRRIAEVWLNMMHEHEHFEKRLRLTENAAEHYEMYLLFHVKNPESLMLVVEYNKQIVGYCLAYKCQNLPMFLPEEYVFISDIALLEAHKNKGLGSHLVDKMMEHYKKDGLSSVHLQVYYKNEKGKRFWRRKGFSPFLTRLWRDL